ncbi:MAG: 5-carboxymethyl-2-hydroxymuconate Delta-isomerase [Acidimicrobiales bacterium]
MLRHDKGSDATVPHLTIEYTANIAEHHSIDGLLDALHHAVLELGVAPVPGVRIRAVRLDDYRVADGSDSNHAFVAMTARIGPGRDDITKKNLIDTLLDAAEAQAATERSPLVIAWSMEVQEIDPDFRVNRNHITAAMSADV